RTRLQIIWSCVAVLVACTWASIHPNIPSPKDNWWKVLRRKIGLMLLCLLAPELLVMWAVRQWVEAWLLWNRYRHRGWTVTHAMFALMGGFALYQGDHLISVLRFRPVEIRRSRESKKILEHFQHEIKERSRVDWFGKLIAIGQTSWFIAQLIARWAQGLAVTELEIMTVAFATMNFIIYYFWWDKPLEVGSHIHIQTVRQTFDTEVVEDGDKQSMPILLKIGLTLDDSPFKDLFYHVVSTIGIAGSSLRTWLTQLFQKNQVSPKTSLHSIIQWPISCGKLICKYLCNVLGKLDRWADKSMSEAGPPHKILSFEYDPHLLVSFFSMTRFILPPGAALIFGVIHCAAWNFIFPTELERSLWRISSAIIIFVPFNSYKLLKVLGIGVVSLYSGLLLGGVILYTGARLDLIVQAFFALRDLPHSALQDVAWTNFIPHI
ncbi:hypothetical protein GYMLUDRAFT_139298, partial [Collybiopsis luxurians FD-317 M1]